MNCELCIHTKCEENVMYSFGPIVLCVLKSWEERPPKKKPPAFIVKKFIPIYFCCFGWEFISFMEVPFFNNPLGIDLEWMEASATSNKFGWFCCDTSPRILKKKKHWVFHRPKVDLGLKTLTPCSMYYTLDFGFSSYFLQGLSC